MSVHFKDKKESVTFALLCSPELIENLQNCGVKVDEFDSYFSLTMIGVDHEVLVIKPGAMVSGIGVVTKKRFNAFNGLVVKALKTLLHEFNNANSGSCDKHFVEGELILTESTSKQNEIPWDTSEPKIPVKAGFKNGVAKVVVTNFVEHESTVGGTEEVSSALQESPIGLIDAVKLGQPVKSSSDESVYFCVALAENMKVGARLLKGHVSVRVEGDIGGNISRLKKAGFDLHPTYASFHVDASAPVLRYKVLGAALFGLGVAFDQIISDVSIIDGKGV